MASPWKSSLSATERYDSVQALHTSHGLTNQDATALEQSAYDTSESLFEYQSKCTNPSEYALPPKEQREDTAATATSGGEEEGKDGDADEDAGEGGEGKDKDDDKKEDTVEEDKDGENEDEDGGIQIGEHTNCHPIASGTTSTVYLSKSATSLALKVITLPSSSTHEPHNPSREIRLLDLLHAKPSIIPLTATFRDQHQRLVLEFPYMPYTLAAITPTAPRIHRIFVDVLEGLRYIHAEGIVHRDVKPSAILLSSPSGPAFLSDFGTAWHPTLSKATEPADNKILDIGTGPYRAPEVLFGNKAYGTPIDMWAVGVMLAEIFGNPLFESRPSHEDGNQLGLILSIFKTLGTPTPEMWPEAKDFKVTPFEMWTVFPSKPWEELLPDVNEGFRDLISALVKFDGSRATAEQVSYLVFYSILLSSLVYAN